MARDYLSTLRADVRDIANLTSNEHNLIDREIQRALDFICADWDWPWLLTAGSISTVASTAEYRMAADMDKYKILSNEDQAKALIDLHPTLFDFFFPDPTATGSPQISVPIGVAPHTTYTTGTVSGTVNTRILTGAGSPAWSSVQGLGRMNRVIVGSNVFTVRSVDSDTQITIYEALPSAIDAGTSYTIILDNMVIRLHTIPDAVETINYRYQRMPLLMAQDTDVPDMPQNWTWLLKHFAIAELWRFKGDESKYGQAWQTALLGLREMKKKVGYPSGSRIYNRRSMDGVRRISRGRYPSNFDIKYSA